MSLADAVRGLLHEALRVYADNPRAVSWLHLQLDRLAGPVRIAVAGPPASGKTTLVNALVGERPGRAWRQVSFVDTPGDAPPAAVAADADAVLYLMRNRHSLAPLGPAPAAAAPVNVIAVLSRADELGAGRIDALLSGKRLARRCRRDPDLHAACQDVVAVAGLIAQAGRTLTASDVEALTALAGLPRDELSGVLLSADRFVHTDLAGVGSLVGAQTRHELLDRVGLFGVRLITTLIRTGFDEPGRLRAELVQRSGLDELRGSIRRFLLDRHDALKARAALLALHAMLHSEQRPAGVALVAELERVLAGAHDLRELRLLAALHAGRTGLPDELSADAHRLVGGDGTGVLERLGIDRVPSDAELRHAIMDALDRWQAHSANPQATEEARRAARVVVRSCEGMLAALYDGVLDISS